MISRKTTHKKICFSYLYDVLATCIHNPTRSPSSPPPNNRIHTDGVLRILFDLTGYNWERDKIIKADSLAFSHLWWKFPIPLHKSD